MCIYIYIYCKKYKYLNALHNVCRYKKNIETWAPPEFQFSRDDLMWGFNTLVTCGWGQVPIYAPKPLIYVPKPLIYVT